VQRLICVSEVQEDTPIRVRFSVHGTRWLPVQVEVEDHMGGWAQTRGGGASVELSVNLPGPFWLAPSEVRLRDPVGVFQRRAVAGRPEPLLILPAPLGRPSIRPSHAACTDDPEPQGLRPYAPGTPLTRVHWPALARGAGLHVRHFAPPPERLPLVVVDTAGTRSPGALAWVARTAAGYVLWLARTGGCRVLLPGDTAATDVVGTGGAWRAVHRKLAMLAELPAPTPSPRAAGGVILRVRAATAPPSRVPAPPLPRGVLRAA
jgi:uncharacterized protein (DUF58 family)